MTHPLIFPEAVFFDWDNTLVDTDQSIYHAMSAVFQHFKNRPLGLEEFRKQPALSVRDSFFALFSADQCHAAEQMFYNKVMQSTFQPFAYSFTLLEYLHKRNIPMGVVSNKKGNFLRQDVEKLGWSSFFRAVVGSCDAPEDKPSAAPLLQALEQSGLNPSKNIWFVGDTEIDMLCAHRSEVTAVAVAPQAHYAAEAEIKVSGIQGLSELLCKI